MKGKTMNKVSILTWKFHEFMSVFHVNGYRQQTVTVSQHTYLPSMELQQFKKLSKCRMLNSHNAAAFDRRWKRACYIDFSVDNLRWHPECFNNDFIKNKMIFGKQHTSENSINSFVNERRNSFYDSCTPAS